MAATPKAIGQRRGNLSRRRLFFLAFALVAGVLMIAVPSSKMSGSRLEKVERPHTLVVYNFGYYDPEHLNNFNYFIKHGIRGGDGARYVIILDHLIATELLELPAFPSNVEVVKAVGPCNELGLVGWLFKRQPSLVDHEFFVFLDSSVRGPFLPVYIHRWGLRWHNLLTGRLTKLVKMVGSTVSCAPFKYHPNDGGYIIHPYLSAYVVATDRVGLRILNETDPSVFHCYHDPLDIKRYGVVALTEAVLKANYNFDTLMLKYDGVDWRDASKWGCNARIDAHLEGHYDGVSLDPLEVMFVRVDHADLVVSTPNVVQALKYESWLETNISSGSQDVGENDWHARSARDLRRVMARGRQCFDAKTYIDGSPFEFKGWSGDRAWEHFVTYGFREGRPYQFTC